MAEELITQSYPVAHREADFPKLLEAMQKDIDDHTKGRDWAHHV